MVRDLQVSLAFYQNILGFSIRMGVDEEKNILVTGISPKIKFIYAQLERDGVEIMLQKQSSMVEDLPVFSGCDIGASVSFYMIVEDIDELFQQVCGKADCIANRKQPGTACASFISGILTAIFWDLPNNKSNIVTCKQGERM